MNDRITEITTKSWGSRIVDSIKGIMIGFLMFVISFGVLYWNEGRIDLSKVADTAVEIETLSEASSEVDGQLVFATGILKSDKKIGDTFLEEGDYLALQRNVEMYAWQEETSTKSKKNVGGSETTETIYSYSKTWTSYPESSSNFKEPTGHQNPQLFLEDKIVKVEEAELGIYSIDIGQVTLPEYKDIELSEENVILNENLGWKLANEQYLFDGIGSINNPEVGDIRVSYSAIFNPLEEATVFGQLDSANQNISPYYGPKNTKLYRVFEGTKDTAITTLKTEHIMITWGLRGLGFFLMWFGLMALFGPLSVLLDVFPVFGSISRAGVGLMTFVAALVLSILTIIISMILHSLLALIIVVLGFIIGVVWYLKKKRKLRSE